MKQRPLTPLEEFDQTRHHIHLMWKMGMSMEQREQLMLVASQRYHTRKSRCKHDWQMFESDAFYIRYYRCPKCGHVK